MTSNHAAAAEAAEFGPEPLTIDDVLEVLDEFDQFGGVSVELVAWELCSPTVRVAPLWEMLHAQKLLVDVGQDPATCERLVRLSRRGRALRRRALCA